MLAVCAKISKHSFLHLDIYSPRHFAYRSLLQRLSKSYIKNVQVSHMTTGLLYACLCVCLCYMIFLATLLSVKILGPSLAGGGRQWHCFGFDCRWWLLNVMCKTLLPYCIEGNTAWLRYRYLKISVEKDRVLGLELGKWHMDFGSPINVDVIPFGLILGRKTFDRSHGIEWVFRLAWCPQWFWDLIMFGCSILFHLGVSFCQYHTDFVPMSL